MAVQLRRVHTPLRARLRFVAYASRLLLGRLVVLVILLVVGGSIMLWRGDPEVVKDLDFVGAEPTDACVTEAFERGRAEIGRAEAWLAGVPESELGRELVIRRRDGELVTIRDLLVHMIEEYARHCGHADLLREAIDGRTGQ